MKNVYARETLHEYLMNKEMIDSSYDNISRIQNFLRYTVFDSENVPGLKKFKVRVLYDCLRFNGFKNKGVQLYRAKATKNILKVSINTERLLMRIHIFF